MRYRSFSITCGALIASLCLSAAASAAAPTSPDPKPMPTREGDNTISMHWDARSERVDLAASSAQFTSTQSIEILTRMVDRRGRVVMRAVLRNISGSERFRVDGRLVHEIRADDGSSTVLLSPAYHRLLKPGGSVVARFVYTLVEGDHTATTGYVANP